MSTITKPRTSVREMFKSLFGSGEDIIEYNEDILTPELRKVRDSINTKSVEEYVNVNGSASKKGGFGKKINPIKDPNTEKAMRVMHKEVQQNTNTVDDIERE